MFISWMKKFGIKDNDHFYIYYIFWSCMNIMIFNIAVSDSSTKLYKV